MPSNQRLDTDQLTVNQTDLGLIEQLKFVAFHRKRQRQRRSRFEFLPDRGLTNPRFDSAVVQAKCPRPAPEATYLKPESDQPAARFDGDTSVQNTARGIVASGASATTMN